MDTKPETIIWYGQKIVVVPVIWSCPCCGTMNVDYKELTVMPLCENCLEAFDWSQLAEVDD